MTGTTRLPAATFRSSRSGPIEEQPSVVVLPVPEPYGKQRIANLVDQSASRCRWRICGLADSRKRLEGAERPAGSVATSHCGAGLSARRKGASRPDSGQAHLPAVPAVRQLRRGHDAALRRGARSARHRPSARRRLVVSQPRRNRDAACAALAAIEWPDDELSVFATLKGTLFAIGDEELLEYRHRFGHFHPFRIPKMFRQASPPLLRLYRCASCIALAIMFRLRRRFPHCSSDARARRLCARAWRRAGAGATCFTLPSSHAATRPTEGFRFADSFEELREQAEDGQAGEAPILEEGSDGVRLMTVHKAKGLEFPVVILADMTAKLRASVEPHSRFRALRVRDSHCRLFAVRSDPARAEELRRDEAEGTASRT